MQTTNQPATPLPYHVGMRQAARIIYDAKGNAVADATVYHGHSDGAEVLANARYIAHAANTYPRAVQVLIQCAFSDMSAEVMRQKLRALLAEFGE